MQKTAKEIDEHIKKICKNSLKENNMKEITEEIFEMIADCPTHPLLDVIESSLQSLMANISRIIIPKKSENTQVAIYIKSLVNHTASELKEQLVSYFHLKKIDGMLEYIDEIIFELCFDTIKEVYFKKERKRDIRYELQRRKLKPYVLRDILKMNPPKFPQEDLDIVFEKSIKIMNLLDKVNTINCARELIIKVHQSIMSELTKYNNGEARTDFVTDDFIDALIYLLVKADIIHLYGMISLLEGFMTSNDDCSEFGFSMRNLQIAARAVVNKL